MAKPTKTSPRDAGSNLQTPTDLSPEAVAAISQAINGISETTI